MTGTRARVCCAVMVLIFGGLIYATWKADVVSSFVTIETESQAGNCQDCHALGSTIVTDENKQFANGTSWHTNHQAIAGDCATCHDPFGEPIPVGIGTNANGCGNCHATECEWQDFHENDQTYLDNVVGPTCFTCHPECEPAETTTTTTTTPSTTTTSIAVGECELTIEPDAVSSPRFFPRVRVFRITGKNVVFQIGRACVFFNSEDIRVLGRGPFIAGSQELLVFALINEGATRGFYDVRVECGEVDCFLGNGLLID